MTGTTVLKRAAALLLALAVLATSLPMLVMQTAAGVAYLRSADPSTMDAWRSLFGESALSTEKAGTVWTDKSVLTDASAFGGTGISMQGNSFLVTLSALAADAVINGVSVNATAGDVSFTDALGEGMTVRDIKGILIGSILFSGATLSRNFVSGGGELGTYDESSALGDEFVRAVRARLGVDGDTARDLIALAYREGQLRYTSDTDFSNYIGWYANAAGEFLGFWYDGIRTMPDPDDPSLTDATRPAYIVRSYGYLGTVDEVHGVERSDMMYATVQVRTSIQSGLEEMLFSLPAALIPTVTYEITTDEDGQPASFTVGGAEHPVRLVYEVAIDERIDEVSVHSYIESGRITPQEDGSVVLRTNRAAESRFTPSTQNGQYYYTEETVICADPNGTPYKGDEPVGITVYTARDVYAPDGIVTVYERVPTSALAYAVQRDGNWYIPVGTPRAAVEKDGDVRVTLTNNGALTLLPQTGIALHCLAEDADEAVYFRYTLTRTDKADNATYKAYVYAKDGSVTAQRVLFEDGVAVVELSSGETLVIYGMTDGGGYAIVQQPHEQYKLVSVNGDTALTRAELTTAYRRVASASFENARKGYGSVTVVKRILHDFGTSYVIPDKQFSVQVTLSEEYADTTLQVEHSGDPSLTTVRTDEHASFVVSLGHGEQLEFLRLKEGTTVTATELDVPTGFVPIYYGAGVKDAASVTVQANTAVSLLILNRYTYEEVEEIPVTVSGTVALTGREDGGWLDTDAFSVELQRYEGDGWVTVATAVASKDRRQFDFTAAMQAEHFTRSGVYSYQVIESVDDIAGVAYDHTVHTFSVTVGDEGMCGHLHVLNVVSHHDHTHVGGEEHGWHIHADFTNTYYAGGHAEAVIDVCKKLINPSQSDRVSKADHRFGLFTVGVESPVFVSDYTDMVGEARLVADFDESGEYVYRLRELIPQEPVAGMVYSDKEYTVTITVTEDVSGALSAQVSITADGEAISTPTFTNYYAPQSATLSLDVKTELTGRDLYDGEFTVQIKEGDTLLAEGVNDENGDVVFETALEFTAVGDYYYDVSEVRGNRGGVSYDLHHYRLHITVTDGGNGALSAHYHVINTAVDLIIFRNTYEATPVSVAVSGVKRLVGRELINEEFSFVLVGAEELRGTILSTSNFADGTFRFEPITLYEEGTYRYTVHEVFESVSHGIVFDDTVYDVTVTVTDEGDGVLRAQAFVCKDGEAVEQIVFVNEYVTMPAKVVLDGTACAHGDGLSDGGYSVELYAADAAWECGERLAVVQTEADGSFVFEPLSFDAEGTYYFIVRQSQTEGEYRVLVDVTDNRRGTILARVTLLRSDGTVAQELMFDITTDTEAPETTTSPATSTTTSPVTSTTTAAAQKNNPETGDVSDPAVWFLLLLVSGGVCMTISVRGRRVY